MDPIALIRAHIPSLTDRAKALLDEALLAASGEEGGLAYEDAAIRECACGVILDGFYAYADHLIELFGGKRILT